MIHVGNLTKTYAGGIEAVKGIDFDVAPGEVFGLLGPNGAGKSTTIGMLTTTIVPTSGTAVVAGFDVAREPIAVRGVSGVVFQDAVVDGSLTGRRNLTIHARLWGGRAGREVIDPVVDAFGLAGVIDREVGTYSGGQRRRLEIARALITRPAVLFLDEPSVGLDPRIRFEMLDLIAGLRTTSETTIILTTHYLDEAERLCDRIAVMHLGEVIALDTPTALLGRLGSEIVEVRVHGSDGAESAMALLRARGIAGGDAFRVGATITVPIHDGSSRDAMVAMHDLPMNASAISSRPPSLDDVYLQLTGDRLAA